MTPRMAPSVRPVGSSRSAMRHQSPSRISRSASARMMSDVACEPELPPELMTSGMNIASTTAFEISPSKCCIAVAVSISERKSAHSQPARLRIMLPKLISVYGSSSASIPPNFCDVFRLLAHDGVDDVVHGDDAEHVARLVDDRHGEQVVLGDEARHLLAIRSRRDASAACVGCRRSRRLAERSAPPSGRAATRRARARCVSGSTQ